LTQNINPVLEPVDEEMVVINGGISAFTARGGS